MTRPVILTHGGAGQWLESAFDSALSGMQQATAAGWAILSNGGSALDAVEKAVNLLEDHPVFDAGIGSFLNEMGEVEMDALIVDGAAITFGAVAAVRNVRYPISLARLVMTKTPHCFFVGDGADKLAVDLGMPRVPNLTFVTSDKFLAFQDRDSRTGETLGTVGAVALDSHGNIASATSTGGTLNKAKGRVGDSPIFGAGR